MTEENELMMEDWQFNKLATAVCKRKESVPELLKAAGINKTELVQLTKKEATTLHYYLHPDQRKQGKGGGSSGTMQHDGVIRHTKDHQCTITVSRGQRGGYGWDIKQVHIDSASAIALIVMADSELRKKFPTTEETKTYSSPLREEKP